jgi:hypothetical protein
LLHVFLISHYVFVLFLDLTQKHGGIGLPLQFVLIRELIRRESRMQQLLDLYLAFPDLFRIYGQLVLESLVNLCRTQLRPKTTRVLIRVGGKVLR